MPDEDDISTGHQPFRVLYPLASDAQVAAHSHEWRVPDKEGKLRHYHVLVWHFALGRIYGNPTNWTVVVETEGEKQAIIAAAEKGETLVNMAIPFEWAYMLRGPRGTILQVATSRQHTEINIDILSAAEIEAPTEDQLSDANELLNDLCRVTEHLKGKIPWKHFTHIGDSSVVTGIYHNQYLANYRAAEDIMDTAAKLEPQIRQEALRYDIADPHNYFHEGKSDHVVHHQMIAGSYWASSILHYFMALEGFVNIAYAVFLDRRIRQMHNTTFARNIEKLDLALKLVMMPILCGDLFKPDARIDESLFKRLKSLVKYRNSLVHARIDDAISTVMVFANPVCYTLSHDVVEQKGEMCDQPIFPARRFQLTHKDAEYSKDTVDLIVKNIVALVQDKHTPFLKKMFESSVVPMIQACEGRPTLGSVKDVVTGDTPKISKGQVQIIVAQKDTEF